MRRRSLGKGLGELIAGDPLASARTLVDVPVNRLFPNPMQPRAEANPDKLEELTRSIETHGVLQPIIVRRKAEDFEIVAGERRWRASQRAGLETVPCIVQEVSDEQSLQLALIENLQREDLNALEAARGYRRLLNEFALTQEQLAQYIGKSRSAIANTLRLLDLPHPVQESVRQGDITEGHGRALLGLSADPDGLLALWERVRENALTVRETERAVRETVAPGEPRPAQPRPGKVVDPNLLEAQDRLQGILATKVSIRPKTGGKGRIEINYSNGEELERLLELLALLA